MGVRAWMWTAEEDAWLHRHYGEESAKRVTMRMNREFSNSRTVQAVQRRAIALGVSKKSPFTDEMWSWMADTFDQYDSGAEQYQAYRERFGDKASSISTLQAARRRYEMQTFEGSKKVRAWIKLNLGEYLKEKEFREAFEIEFGTRISTSTFRKLVKREEQSAKKDKQELLDILQPMRHIRMRASDYRRLCCECGRRTYQAETVIGKDGKKKTYCPQCSKKGRRKHAR